MKSTKDVLSQPRSDIPSSDHLIDPCFDSKATRQPQDKTSDLGSVDIDRSRLAERSVSHQSN